MSTELLCTCDTQMQDVQQAPAVMAAMVLIGLAILGTDGVYLRACSPMSLTVTQQSYHAPKLQPDGKLSLSKQLPDQCCPGLQSLAAVHLDKR